MASGRPQTDSLGLGGQLGPQSRSGGVRNWGHLMAVLTRRGSYCLGVNLCRSSQKHDNGPKGKGAKLSSPTSAAGDGCG